MAVSGFAHDLQRQTRRAILQQVANAAACAPDKFYIENNTVKLCPQTCDKVQTDPTAAIKVLFGCKPKGAN